MSKIRDHWGYTVLRVCAALGVQENIRSSCFDARLMSGYLPLSEEEEKDFAGTQVFFEARATKEGPWKIFLYSDASWPLKTPLINFPGIFKEIDPVATRDEALAEIRKWERIGQRLYAQCENNGMSCADMNVNHISRIDSVVQAVRVAQVVVAREGNLVRADFTAARARPAAAASGKLRARRAVSRSA